jgi:formamidopyrimidine-DNA glycosylase
VPELPEVERARAAIETGALTRRIASVDDSDTWVCRPHSPGEIADALTGAALTEAHRRGKAMWVETDRGPVLGLHLGMSGRIDIDAEPAPNHWDRFSIAFEDGGRLALYDRRRLGRVVLDPDLVRVGPDAAEVGRREFHERVGRGSAPVKARIMDQATISGVGNLLADEVLWKTGLSPLTPAGELSDEDLDRLRRATRAAIRRAIHLGGAHTGDLIAHRGPDGSCPRCGEPLRRAKVGGRTTYWCPRHQPER